MRKRLYAMMSLYAKITTGILFVAAVYISVFYGWEEELGVEILWQILGLAGACTLGSLLLPADGEQEVSKKSMLARIVGYYVYVNVIVLLCGFLFGWLEGYSTESAHEAKGGSTIAVGDKVEISYRGTLDDEEHPTQAVKIVIITGE